jgi:aspartate racemase
MKCLGLIGGLDAILPRIYWELINDEVESVRGPGYSANLLARSVDVTRLAQFFRRKDWAKIEMSLIEEGRVVKAAGADGLVICSNALGPARAAVSRAVRLPVICMADAVAKAFRELRFRRVAVLGIRTKREDRWWSEGLRDISRVRERAAVRVWLKGYVESRLQLNERNLEGSRIEGAKLVSGYRRDHAQAIVLAAPRLRKLILADDSLIPVFDAVDIHARAAAAWAMQDNRSARSPGANCVLWQP